MSELFNQPRVYRTPDMKWKGGPQNYGKKVINPQAAKVAQSIETHIDVYAPGGYGQKHGHMNSAVFFVLKGKGHDVHDGRRIDWEAGDALIVENGCVHQHFNDDPDEEGIVLIMKAKPLFLFMHLIFKKMVEAYELLSDPATRAELERSKMAAAEEVRRVKFQLRRVEDVLELLARRVRALDALPAVLDAPRDGGDQPRVRVAILHRAPHHHLPR